jgi:hypothetical protein
MIVEYIDRAMSKAVYDKLEDGLFPERFHNVLG